MKIAFSTISTPEWDFETVALRAKELGYDGIELFGELNQTLETSSALFTTLASKVLQPFSSRGLSVCALTSSITMTGNADADIARHDQVITLIDKASSLNCPLAVIADVRTLPGQNRDRSAAALADWLLPLGDYAAERGVMLAIENRLSFRRAREIWAVLDRLNHPSVGCCWDVCNAALAGEAPAVSVPTLNSRIVHARVKDAKTTRDGIAYCELGDGDVRIEDFVSRLRGIGYSSWLSVELAPGALLNLADQQQSLQRSIEMLRSWSTPRKAAPARKHSTVVK